MNQPKLQTTCCIVGGGPAGLVLGYLLARKSVDVIVVEKHADFFRDFRGDTIHPTTLELMYELGILNEFLQLPHQEIRQLQVQIGSDLLTVADFSLTSLHCKFMGFMPQWDFLNFIRDKASHYPNFKLMMETQAESIIKQDGKICGIKAVSNSKPVEIFADLVVGADGRASTMRQNDGMRVVEYGVPIDVLWFRLLRNPSADPKQTLGRIDYGRMLIALDRGKYWQIGYVCAKGSFDQLRKQPIETFQRDIMRMFPMMADRVHDIQSWDDVKLLSVQINRLEKWFDEGLLCIGDAAHAMSPAGGIGINLAVQDAIAAANILGDKLAKGTLRSSDLAKVQQRRELPTKRIQSLQVFIHQRIFSYLSGKQGEMHAPLWLKILAAIAPCRAVFPFVMHYGVQREKWKN